ncbi:MAG: peptidylprolyl isomerase [Meiothermus sp.]
MEPANPVVRFETALGSFRVELYPKQAPLTVGNFLRYVREGRYREASFYRTVRPNNQPDSPVEIEVIQGGLGMEPHPLRLPPVEHEATDRTGLTHRDGTISMGRLEPGTAASEFFFCIGDQPELDRGGHRNPDGQGFAAFGQAIEGLEVLRAIYRQPSVGQYLDPPVPILAVVLE